MKGKRQYQDKKEQFNNKIRDPEKEADRHLGNEMFRSQTKLQWKPSAINWSRGKNVSSSKQGLRITHSGNTKGKIEF